MGSVFRDGVSAAAALLLSACASVPQSVPGLDRPLPALPSLQTDMAVGHVGKGELAVAAALPWAPSADGTLFSGQFGVQDTLGVFALQSRFSISAGDAVDPAQWSKWMQRPDALPESLGTRVSEQRLSTRVGDLAGAPLTLDYSLRDEGRWLLARSEDLERQIARLAWAPGVADLQLSWTAADSPATPPLLDCPLEGQIGVAGGARRPGLKLSARSCTLFSTRAPELDVAGTWSAAATLPIGGDARTTFSLRSIDPGASQASGLGSDPRAAYELQWAQSQRIAGWQARSALMLHSSAATAERPRQQQWSVEAQVQRRLEFVRIAAKLRNGVEDDWFLPGGATRARAVELGVDLSDWAAVRLPGQSAALSLSWQWSERQLPGADVGDFAFRSDLRLPF